MKAVIDFSKPVVFEARDLALGLSEPISGYPVQLEGVADLIAHPSAFGEGGVRISDSVTGFFITSPAEDYDAALDALAEKIARHGDAFPQVLHEARSKALVRIAEALNAPAQGPRSGPAGATG